MLKMEDGLAVDQLTVVGIVTDPFYISVEKESSTIGSGKIDAILYTGEESFSLDVYTDFYLTIEGADEFEYFSDEYEEYIDEQLQVIQPVADERAGTRYQSVYNEARGGAGKRQNGAGKRKSTGREGISAGRAAACGYEDYIRAERVRFAGSQGSVRSDLDAACKNGRSRTGCRMGRAGGHAVYV